MKAKYHLFLAGSWGVEHLICRNMKEVKKFQKELEKDEENDTVIVGIVKGVEI